MRNRLNWQHLSSKKDLEESFTEIQKQFHTNKIINLLGLLLASLENKPEAKDESDIIAQGAFIFSGLRDEAKNAYTGHFLWKTTLSTYLDNALGCDIDKIDNKTKCYAIEKFLQHVSENVRILTHSEDIVIAFDWIKQNAVNDIIKLMQKIIADDYLDHLPPSTEHIDNGISKLLSDYRAIKKHKNKEPNPDREVQACLVMAISNVLNKRKQSHTTDPSALDHDKYAKLGAVTFIEREVHQDTWIHSDLSDLGVKILAKQKLSDLPKSIQANYLCTFLELFNDREMLKKIIDEFAAVCRENQVRLDVRRVNELHLEFNGIKNKVQGYIDELMSEKSWFFAIACSVAAGIVLSPVFYGVGLAGGLAFSQTDHFTSMKIKLGDKFKAFAEANVGHGTGAFGLLMASILIDAIIISCAGKAAEHVGKVMGKISGYLVGGSVDIVLHKLSDLFAKESKDLNLEELKRIDPELLECIKNLPKASISRAETLQDQMRTLATSSPVTAHR